MGLPWLYWTLRTVAPVLTLAFYLLVGWLAYRHFTGRLGQTGTMLLYVLGAAALLGVPWTIALRNLYTPEQAWTTLGLLVGGAALLLVVREFLRLFPFAFPVPLAFVLTGPLRRLVLPAEPVLSQLGLGPGLTVVEVGPGPGFFTFDLAARVQPGGRVVCVDVQPGMLARIQARAEQTGVDNIETRLGRAEELPLDPMSAHMAFIAMVLGETRDKQAALNDACRVLIPGGLLVVVESIIDPHYCTKPEVKKLAARAGLDEWSMAGGPLSYTALYRKPGQYHWRRY
jgi:precorrin-6B methylase 2